MVKIVSVTANPAIDLSTSVERLQPFQKLRCNEARHDPGGGGINVSRVLKRFGMHSIAVFPTGGPTGDLLNQLAAKEEIDALAVPVKGDTREDFTAYERSTGKQFRFVFPGSPLSESECDSLLDALQDLKPSYLVASGSLAPGTPASLYARAIQLAAASGTKVILDTSGPALASALSQGGVYLVKPNLRELQELTGEPLETEAQRLYAARKLIGRGGAEIVALTLADQGALIVTRDLAWRAYAPKVTPLSTVGAGDSFLGAMLWRLASVNPLADALQYAVAAGTAALLAPGTALCRPNDVIELLPEVRVQELCHA